MRLLLAHNYYQLRGGEAEIFETEAGLLESHGHRVIRYTVHNDAIDGMGRLEAARATLWNRQVYDALRRLLRAERPDVAHFHNTFPLISPAAYYAARAENVPVVQTIHNYRLLCPKAQFFREGRVCEDCLGRSVALPGIVHGCYRDSRAASTVVAAMLALHRARRTWSEMVDVYVLAMTEFAREKFVEGGFPAEKLVVKPNFVYPDPGPGTGRGGYALFVGRLSEEKGIRTMLAAWERLDGQIPLHVVGDGPLAATVEAAAGRRAEITWLGRQPSEEVYRQMGEAACLIFPSVWYEGLPRTIVESFARGTPVIASNLGAMSSLIDPDRTGLHFEAGNAEDLAARVRWWLAHPEAHGAMREAARAAYERHFTAEANYRQLMQIYETALRAQAGRSIS